MGRTYSKVFDSAYEYFMYSHDKIDLHDDKSMDLYESTKKGSGFYGKHDDVFNKFMMHDVKNDASMMSSVMDDMATEEFSESKWVFEKSLDEGDSVDVNKYLDESDRYWSGFRRRSKPKDVIRVYCQFGGNCDKTREQLTVNGALGVTLVEMLESSGFNVELWCVNRVEQVTREGSNLNMLVKVKGANEFSDLGTMQYIMGDSFVFRNISFRSWCRFIEEKGETPDYGLGCTGVLSYKNLGIAEEEQASSIIVPPIYDRDGAVRWLKDFIRKLKEDGR